MLISAKKLAVCEVKVIPVKRTNECLFQIPWLFRLLCIKIKVRES